MARSVSITDLSQPLVNGDDVTDRIHGQIAVAKLRVGQRDVLWELVIEDVPQPSQLGFDPGAGVMSNEIHDPFIETLTTEKPGAIDRMKPGFDDLRRVPDIMQDGSVDQELRPLGANNVPKLDGLHANALNMQPPLGQIGNQEALRQGGHRR